ncbi:hypothetical protein LPJ78_001796 [Coemansia sp. RSA 989]|nr:hypothetical protein BX667DRAFT_506511 [Coemansia mojavensis]KAJ1739683.1 hypothetical protein LPJ68_004456 [Coemansia sp. RSA 1086]KAJ1748161.1 hypothetical protein LPJ79_004754 [Coemansia sp. RSA 1821]KAJ1866435.1 hypothetical protein LPJ78_001796 [Coemansia sp. RSA 989]KAJ1874163.1 hypothetical protein LPJ55_001763 [Coemansia sp. RSA 990]KAJ2629677.1 hypothetical protein H4R22_003181 [Coemansia sp. RSA 1290]KAJ2649208.1 hypothetical protein IWW40_003334 [Coemansia sp. RSA 1250]KAJ26706
MLKAFSKVFHKSHGAADEPQAVTRGAESDSQLPSKRVLERHRPAELGLGSVAGPGDRNSSSPRRNGGSGNRYSRPHALDVGMRPVKDPGKRASLQQRMEQHMQPRLHVKGPAQGSDGRFPLTSDNIDWHLRMLPPVKESKYERIIRYVQDQQQNIPAVVDPAQPPLQPHDIEASMLMSGSPMHHDYSDPPYSNFKSLHGHLHPLTHNGTHPAAYGAATGMSMLVPPRPGGGLQAPRMPGDRGFVLTVQRANHTTSHQTEAAAAAGQRTGSAAPATTSRDIEEDDNTPLGAINMNALRPRSMDVVGLEKYAPASLNDPLPGPGSPANDARLSMASFQSNMAVNLNSDANEVMSRSLSISNPLSASANDQTAPDGRTASQVHNRPSLDAITPTAQEFGAEITGHDSLSPTSSEHEKSGDDSASNMELRVVNNVSSSESSDDNQPLVTLGRKLSEKQAVQIATNVSKRADHSGNENRDDDDDQPLSALLFQPLNNDDLGSLPLPAPRHITDPDAVADLEEVAPSRRSSTGDRSASPIANVTRKKSLLSRTYTPGNGEDSENFGSGSAKRRSNLRYSSSPSPLDDGFNSLPRPPKSGAVSQEEDSSIGRPWLANRQYSSSTTSVNSRKHAHRGSTLGQQLTDELQRVREDIARTRQEAERRSWQLGDPPVPQKPWMRHENALSDTALQTPQQPATNPHQQQQRQQSSFSENINHGIAGGDEPKLPSSWSYSDKPRPMSTQNHRFSRWFGMPLRLDSSSADAVPSPSQPLGTSLSSRINSKFGRLKRTLKPGTKL